MTVITETYAEVTPAKPRWRNRLLVGAATVAIVIGGVVVGQEAWLQSTYGEMAAAAERVDIGGRSINLVCSGTGDTTYVLEAGATGFAETWTWVQGNLDDDARVCSYDRAGLGLSDPNPDGFAADGVAGDLLAALNAAGETGPFVLVGHSLGGFFVRSFAAAYPEQVRALVLVDPSHEDQLEIFGPEAAEQTRSFPSVLQALATASSLGLLHLYSPLLAGADGLPQPALSRAAFHAQNRGHLAASGDEIANWGAMESLVERSVLPASLPVMVVSAGVEAEGMDGLSEKIVPLHQELASRFTNGRHETMQGADHFTILMHEEQAVRLSGLIKTFVAEAAG